MTTTEETVMLAPDVDPPTHAEAVRLHCLVSSGLDGAIRMMMMLRTRKYRVATISMETRECAVGFSYVTVELSLDVAEVPLLLARLERMLVVVSTEVEVATTGSRSPEPAC